MVSRLIHRHVVADGCFPGASVGQLSDVTRGDIAIFGVNVVAALAIRDAANAHFSRAEALCRRIDLGNLDEAIERLPAVLHDIEARGARSFMLGGDPEMGTTFFEALAKTPGSAPPSIILLSSRIDVRLPQAGTFQAVAIGTQRLIGQSTYDAWREAGGKVVPAATYDANCADKILSAMATKVRTALLLVDLAVIDTGYAAGALMRNVGGLSPMAVLDLVDRIISQFDLRGLALLNIAPDRDPRGHSERIAAIIADRVCAQDQSGQAA